MYKYYVYGIETWDPCGSHTGHFAPIGPTRNPCIDCKIVKSIK